MKFLAVISFICYFSLILSSAILPNTDNQNSRIFNGHNASPHSAPYMVSLQIESFGTRFHNCGGSIIAPSWVVTAAHCLLGNIPLTLQLVAGRHNIHIAEASEQRRYVNPARVWMHEWYTGSVAPFDIGLVHAAPAFVYNAFVNQIALPAPEYIHSGIGTVFGWGFISNSPNTFPSILQTVSKPILPNTQCVALLGQTSSFHYTNLCTGPLTGGISTCTGDSGGPLVQNGQLIGIVSWGPICGTPPSVYVRVSAFNGWIANILSNN